MFGVVRDVALSYARRSELDADHKESIERQNHNNTQEAKHNGWRIEYYSEPEGHRSGRHEKNRPAWHEIKSQLDRPEVVALIVESLSRACRSVKDLSNLIEQLDERGIIFVSVKERIETRTAAGRLFLHMLAAIAQFESDIASERMAGSIEFKKKQKGRHWGCTPFGCERQGDDHVLVPSTQGATVNAVWRGYHEALFKCCEWYCTESIGFQLLGDRLNGAGYRFRDRHGNPRLFTHSDIRRILDSHRIYAGFVFAGAAKDHPTEFYKGSHAPILPLELCDRVAETLGSRQRYVRHLMTSERVVRTYLLTPILHCDICGKQMVGMFQDGQRWYRHDRAKRGCTAKGQVNAEDLEKQIMDRLAAFNMPEVLRERIESLARQMSQQQQHPDTPTVQARVKALSQKLGRLKEMRIEGEFTKAEYEQRKTQVEGEIRKANAELRSAPHEVKSLEDLLPKIERIAEVIRGGSAENKKKLFATLFERIEQQDGQVTVAAPRAWAKPFFMLE